MSRPPITSVLSKDCPQETKRRARIDHTKKVLHSQSAREWGIFAASQYMAHTALRSGVSSKTAKSDQYTP